MAEWVTVFYNENGGIVEYNLIFANCKAEAQRVADEKAQEIAEEEGCWIIARVGINCGC